MRRFQQSRKLENPVSTNQLFQARGAGIAAVPQKWFQEYDNLDHWKALAPSQMFGRAGQGRPLNYAKACLVVAVLHEYAARHAPGYDIFDFPFDPSTSPASRGRVSICPALWIVDGLNNARYNSILSAVRRNGLEQRLNEATRQSSAATIEPVFAHLALRQARCTARLVHTFLDFVRGIDGSLVAELSPLLVQKRLFGDNRHYRISPNGAENVHL
jgi:hypothetical protein